MRGTRTAGALAGVPGSGGEGPPGQSTCSAASAALPAEGSEFAVPRRRWEDSRGDSPVCGESDRESLFHSDVWPGAQRRGDVRPQVSPRPPMPRCPRLRAWRCGGGHAGGGCGQGCVGRRAATQAALRRERVGRRSPPGRLSRLADTGNPRVPVPPAGCGAGIPGAWLGGSHRGGSCAGHGRDGAPGAAASGLRSRGAGRCPPCLRPPSVRQGPEAAWARYPGAGCVEQELRRVLP